jgi:hypothetical protein
MNVGEENLDAAGVAIWILTVRVLGRLILRTHPPSDIIHFKILFHQQTEPAVDRHFQESVKKIALFECGERRCWALDCNHVVRGMKSRAVGEEDERTPPDLQISGIIQLVGIVHVQTSTP